MTYKELIENLQTPPENNPVYWRTLITNAEVILLQIAKTNQGVVARDLKMSSSKLSNILPILKEYSNEA